MVNGETRTALAATWFRDAASKKQLRTFFEGLGGSDKSFSAMKLTLLLICNAKECTRSGISAWSCLRTSNPTNEYDQNLEPRCHAVKVSHRMAPWLNMTKCIYTMIWMYHVHPCIHRNNFGYSGSCPLITLCGSDTHCQHGSTNNKHLPSWSRWPGGGHPGVTPPTWALTWVSTLVAGRKGWGFLCDSYNCKKSIWILLDIPERSWKGGLIFIESLDFLFF